MDIDSRNDLCSRDIQYYDEVSNDHPNFTMIITSTLVIQLH